jgi:predicted nucleotidyltransferase component of viral defense system
LPKKIIFLAIVLKIIFASDISNRLVFKGGTALYHVYLPQLRFSEDLDFSCSTQNVDLNAIKNIFSDIDFLEIKKEYVSATTIKIEKLQYAGPLGQPNSLKIDIDYWQNVILPPLIMDYKNIYGVNIKVRVMDIKEIAAEKIKVMSDRARYRDYYDFVMILNNFKINLVEILELVRNKEIRQTISLKNILNNWHIAKEDQQTDTQNIYYHQLLSNLEIENKLSQLHFKNICQNN